MSGGGYSSSIATGRVTSGETDLLITPRDGAQGQRGVILHHGAAASPNGAGWWMDATNQPNALRLVTYLGRHLVVVAGNFTGDQWGNATDVTDMDAAKALLVANGCASDKVMCVGLSAGFMSTMGYVRDKGSAGVACVAGLEPATNLNDIWTRNIFGVTQATISTAWATAFPGTLPINADPYAAGATAYRAQLAAVPGKLYYSSADTIVLPTYTETLAGLVGYQVSKVSTIHDHGDAQIGDIDVADLLHFLLAHAAPGT